VSNDAKRVETRLSEEIYGLLVQECDNRKVTVSGFIAELIRRELQDADINARFALLEARVDALENDDGGFWT
jgi:hypothetical protein